MNINTNTNVNMYLNVQNLKPQGQALSDLLAAFEGDFNRDLPFVGKLRLHEINPWLGDVGAHAATTSPLHYDPYDNVYALLRGRKRWWLEPPRSRVLSQLHPRRRRAGGDDATAGGGDATDGGGGEMRTDAIAALILAWIFAYSFAFCRARLAVDLVCWDCVVGAVTDDAL